MLQRMWSSRTSHALLAGPQNGVAALKEAVSYELNRLLSRDSVIMLPGVGARVENLCLYKNLKTDVYSSFIEKCPNLETT